MINTTQTTTYNLTLTADQFDVLHDLLEDTFEDINDNIDHEEIRLSDYELYDVYQQMNNIKGVN